MVMIAESDINRCKPSQFREEPKKVRESVSNIEKVAGDEDPIGPEFGDAANDGPVSWTIAVQVQVTQVHGAAAGQRSVNERQMGDSRNRETDLKAWHQIEQVVEGAAEPMADPNACELLPPDQCGDHSMPRFKRALSWTVTRYP